jgi:tetratricopeptide (TPR) repeat protein
MPEATAKTGGAGWPDLREELIRAGEQPDPTLFARIAALGSAVIPGLIELATDSTFDEAEQDDPAVWTPLHAIRILGEMQAAAAVEPFMTLLGSDDYTVADAVQEALGRIGAPALPPLCKLLPDRSQDASLRNRAAAALQEAAKSHPELRADVVEALVAQLDPAETQTPEDERLNAFVIGALLDIQAVEALPAIERAFSDDRVDTSIVDFGSVQREFDLPGAPPLPSMSMERLAKTDSLTLRLECTACGFERPHRIAKIYYDPSLREKKTLGERSPYSDFVIPQRIICPKCGAVDQYRLGANAMLALTAEVLRQVALKKSGEAQNEEGPLFIQRFALQDGRSMHPLEARDMYRRQIEAEPEHADLRLHYGNILRFLGYEQEALDQYAAAVERDPTNIEALYSAGTLLHETGDLVGSRRRLEQVLEVAQRNPNLARRHHAMVESAGDMLGYPAGLQLGDRLPAVPESASRAGVVPSAGRVEKVGRNDLCPCGSGKKYKRCHGR